MELDLIFTAIKNTAWQQSAEQGFIEAPLFSKDGRTRTFLGMNAEKIINHHFPDDDTVMLIVIDPLRIQDPIKKIKQDEMDYIEIRGKIPIEAVIDKIKLEKNKKGSFAIRVNHFD